MIYLDSKYLAKCLGINSAKWKRWAREFLDPDPLGGFQSGYARQFNNKEAFRVYLGGYIVGELKFTIPEARQILSDLNTWLTKKRIYSLQLKKQKSDFGSHHIYLYRLEEGKFGYAIRSISNVTFEENSSSCEEHFSLYLIGLPSYLYSLRSNDYLHANVIYISHLYHEFVVKITSA